MLIDYRNIINGLQSKITSTDLFKEAGSFCVTQKTFTHEDKPVKHCKALKTLGHILCMFVSLCVVSKNPHTPNWSFMADDTITQCGIDVLGSPFSICATYPL